MAVRLGSKVARMGIGGAKDHHGPEYVTRRERKANIRLRLRGNGEDER